MKMKKVLIIVLTFICIIALIAGILILEKKYKSNNEYKVQEGIFEYAPFSEIVQEKYYYSDGYFTKSGKEVDEHLRTMSMILAFSAITSDNNKNPDEYSIKLLTDIGFKNIVTENIEADTPYNSIGSAIAYKKIGDNTVIAVAIRGAKYYKEWIANMQAGETGNIDGFSEASEIILDRIRKYKEDNNIKKCKIWSAGFSRGGATANLVGKYINENLDEFNTTADDLYIYTFEAPLSSSEDIVYENIHNVINSDDLVTYVYPEKWGIYNNGVKEIINKGSEIITKKEFSIIQRKVVDCLDKNQNEKTIEIKEFLNDFINWITNENKLNNYSFSRENYFEKIETPLNYLLELYYEKSYIEKKEIFLFFKDVVEEIKKEENLNELKKILPDLKSGNYSIDNNKLFDLLKKNIEIVFESSNSPLTLDELNKIEESIFSIGEVIVPILISSAFDRESTLGFNMNLTGFYHITTFINSLPKLIENHFPTKNLKMVQELDSYYTENK